MGSLSPVKAHRLHTCWAGPDRLLRPLVLRRLWRLHLLRLQLCRILHLRICRGHAAKNRQPRGCLLQAPPPRRRLRRLTRLRYEARRLGRHHCAGVKCGRINLLRLRQHVALVRWEHRVRVHLSSAPGVWSDHKRGHCRFHSAGRLLPIVNQHVIDLTATCRGVAACTYCAGHHRPAQCLGMTCVAESL